MALQVEVQLKCSLIFIEKRQEHKVLIYKEYRRNWDSPNPTPLSPASVPLHPERGGHTRLRVRGWGVPIPTTGEKA
jgi:hypothetical protein